MGSGFSGHDGTECEVICMRSITGRSAWIGLGGSDVGLRLCCLESYRMFE
jgi:hypothetical protein